MNVQGVVKYVYDNRLTKDGTPNKFPNFKFKVNDQEIVLWSAIKPIFLEKGKNLTMFCWWKGTDPDAINKQLESMNDFFVPHQFTECTDDVMDYNAN